MKTPAVLRAERLDRQLSGLRIAIAVAAIGVWVAGRRRGRSAARASRARGIALGTLALLAAAANYNFFVSTRLHRHEFFHYYLGSKYFPELGYARLYECAVEALASRGGTVLPAEMTDLRSKRRRPTLELMREARPCAPDFGAARWAQFQEDVGRFARVLPAAVRDHGYNPSPVWTLVGRPIAETLSAKSSSLWVIARLDLLLLLLAFAVVRWGFGWDVACLAAIAWGTCGHTRYQWTGDAFLRQMWLASALAALAFARRGRFYGAGALFAFSAGLRLFPLLFVSGFALRETWRLARERYVRPEAVRLAAGALLTGGLLFAASTAVSGRGFEAWREFASNLRLQTSFVPLNGLGLDALLTHTPARPPVPATAELEAQVQAEKALAREARRPLGIAVLAVFALLFARAVRPEPGVGTSPPRLDDAETLMLGALAIPFVTLPASYYLGFALVGALLAARRPAIGTSLLAACTLWSASLVIWPGRALAHEVSSGVLVLWSLLVLLAVQRPPPAEAATRGSAPLAGAIDAG